MSKAIILGGILAAGTAAAAVSYYVSPAAPSNLNVPPIEAPLSASEAVLQLRRMTPEDYFARVATNNDGIPHSIAFRTMPISDNHVRFTMRISGDLVSEVDAIVAPGGPHRAIIDVRARLTDSKFRRHRALHPYDIKVLESAIDLTVTDYISSVIKAERMASRGELAKALDARTGFSAEQDRAFGWRVQRALDGSYASDLRPGYDRARSDNRPYNLGEDSLDSRYGDPMMRPDGRDPSPRPGYGNRWSRRYYPGDEAAAAAEAGAAADAAMEAAEAARAAVR
jgi:hypothetical protein